jgi:hypothetical protein
MSSSVLTLSEAVIPKILQVNLLPSYSSQQFFANSCIIIIITTMDNAFDGLTLLSSKVPHQNHSIEQLRPSLASTSISIHPFLPTKQ